MCQKKIADRGSTRDSIILRDNPQPLSPSVRAPIGGAPAPPRTRALEQSMEIITLMASPTRERGTTRARHLLPPPFARKASLEWERSRHLDGNVTLPAPPLASFVQNGALAPSRAARSGASEPARAFFVTMA